MLKLKGGVFPPEEEVEAIRRLREAFGPGVELRIDPNAAWSVDTSVRFGRALEEVGLEYYEDPTKGMAQMAEVRRRLKVPLATNMCVTSFDHLKEMADVEPVDVILSDHHVWGGLRESVRLSRFCRDFALGVSMHSNSHLGISMAAMVHLGAAMPRLTYSCDTHYPWQEGHDLLKGNPWRFEDGFLRVPDGPGLGVEIDPAKLEALAANYESCGIRDRDDASEMRKYRPDWNPEDQAW